MPTGQPSRSAHRTVAGSGAALLEVAACSDKGPVRSENQDAWAVHPLGDRGGCVVLLADGMGGHADGGIAAYLAVTAAGQHLLAAADPQAALSSAVDDANRAIAARRVEHGAVSGTTLVAAVVTPARVRVANVGDSRAYLVSSGDARQLTADHSWVAEQVRAGMLSPEEAVGNPRRNLLTRALTGEDVAADVVEVTLGADDTLLLCCDGVWDVLDDNQLAAAMSGAGTLDALVEGLVDTALQAGATDNVTAVACRRLPADAPAQPPAGP